VLADFNDGMNFTQMQSAIAQTLERPLVSFHSKKLSVRFKLAQPNVTERSTA